MERRSTNDVGFTHYLGDVTAQVGSSHGVRLSGGSTGGVLEAVGDDTNVSLRIRAQGSAGIIFGNGSGSTISPSAIKGVYSATFTNQIAAISSGAVLQSALSTATGNFAPGDLISIDAVVTPAEAVYTGFRTAADATTRVTMLISNPGSTATSTGRIVGTITWFDLT